MYVCMYVYVCMYICMCVCMYVCMCVCMYVCMHVCVYVCVCMCVCMYVCMHVCVCISTGATNLTTTRMSHMTDLRQVTSHTHTIPFSSVPNRITHSNNISKLKSLNSNLPTETLNEDGHNRQT